MKSVINYLLVMYIIHYCIGDDSSWYKLLNGSRADVGKQCTEWNGNITIFRDVTSRELKKIFDDNDQIRIWNGYKYTSDWLENTGCFRKSWQLIGHNKHMADMTIADCEMFCKIYGPKVTLYAIKESECLCVPMSRNNPTFLTPSDDRNCINKCNMSPDEFCGSKMNSALYNIYAVREPIILEDPNLSDDGLCLLYRRNDFLEDMAAAVCDVNFRTSIECRHKSNTTVRIGVSNSTWTSSMNACLRSNRSKSYLVSCSDLKNVPGQRRTMWLNERKYRTTVEINDGKLETCHILSKGSTGYVIHELTNCRNTSGINYVCKKGFTSNGPSTSTLTYEQNVSSDIRNSPLGDHDSNDSDGSLIGGVTGALVVVTAIAGIIVVFVFRKKPPGSRKEQSQYQSQKVMFSKSNGITNNGYCSEAIIDIIQGNPDRNSQENYMTIKDEDLQTLRNAKPEANKSADQNTSSPSDGPLYMVLEETKSVSEVAASIPNYELAKHIPNNESGGKENCEHNEENVEYDHLRQDAYKQAQEDAHPPADIADDYSHISQVTNVNEDNYTHTENYMHTYTPRNEEEEDAYAHAQNSDYDRMVSEGDTRNSNPYDLAENVDNLQYDSTKCTTDRNEEEEDAYAHAQKNDYDSMVSEDDTRDSNPYDLAENVDNLQYDSTECKTDSFVQLDADNGNYSFAKPVDVTDETLKG